MRYIHSNNYVLFGKKCGRYGKIGRFSGRLRLIGEILHGRLIFHENVEIRNMHVYMKAMWMEVLFLFT